MKATDQAGDVRNKQKSFKTTSLTFLLCYLLIFSSTFFSFPPSAFAPPHLNAANENAESGRLPQVQDQIFDAVKEQARQRFLTSFDDIPIDSVDSNLLRYQEFTTTTLRSGVLNRMFLRRWQTRTEVLGQTHIRSRRPRPVNTSDLQFEINDSGHLIITNPLDGVDPNAKHVIRAAQFLAVSEDAEFVYLLPARNPTYVLRAAQEAFGEDFSPNRPFGFYRIPKEVVTLAYGNDPIRATYQLFPLDTRIPILEEAMRAHASNSSEFSSLRENLQANFSVADVESDTTGKIVNMTIGNKDISLNKVQMKLRTLTEDIKLLLLSYFVKGQIASINIVGDRLNHLLETVQRLQALSIGDRAETAFSDEVIEGLTRDVRTILRGGHVAHDDGDLGQRLQIARDFQGHQITFADLNTLVRELDDEESRLIDSDVDPQHHIASLSSRLTDLDSDIGRAFKTFVDSELPLEIDERMLQIAADLEDHLTRNNGFNPTSSVHDTLEAARNLENPPQRVITLVEEADSLLREHIPGSISELIAQRESTQSGLETLRNQIPNDTLTAQLYRQNAEGNGKSSTSISKAATVIHQNRSRLGFLPRLAERLEVPAGIMALFGTFTISALFFYFQIYQELILNGDAYRTATLQFIGFYFDLAKMVAMFGGSLLIFSTLSNYLFGHRRFLTLTGLGKISYYLFVGFTSIWKRGYTTVMESGVVVQNQLNRMLNGVFGSNRPTDLNYSFRSANPPSVERSRRGLIFPIDADIDQAEKITQLKRQLNALEAEINRSQFPDVTEAKRQELIDRKARLKHAYEEMLQLRMAEMDLSIHGNARTLATATVIWSILKEDPQYKGVDLSPENVASIMAAYFSRRNDLNITPHELERYIQMYELLLLKDLSETSRLVVFEDHAANILRNVGQDRDRVKLRLKQAVELSSHAKGSVIELANFYTPQLAGTHQPSGNISRQALREVGIDVVISDLAEFLVRGMIIAGIGTAALYSTQFGLAGDFIQETMFQLYFGFVYHTGITNEISTDITEQKHVEKPAIRRLGHIVLRHLTPFTPEGKAHFDGAAKLYVKVFFLRVFIRALGDSMAYLSNGAIPTFDFWSFYLFVAAPILTLMTLSTYKLYRMWRNNKLKPFENYLVGGFYGIISGSVYSWLKVLTMARDEGGVMRLSDLGWNWAIFGIGGVLAYPILMECIKRLTALGKAAKNKFFKPRAPAHTSTDC